MTDRINIRAWAVLVLLALGGCSSNRISSDGAEAQASALANSIPVISVGAFRDRVAEDGEDSPVADDAGEAFTRELEKRGLLAEERRALFEVSGDILESDVSHLITPSAEVRVRVRVRSLRGGSVLHAGVYRGKFEAKGVRLWSANVSDSTGDMQARALAAAAESALDDPKLRGVLIH